ncbi:ABC transporter ATP-binding protein [Salinibius halmophilus]|uniref:ABC transporter ATP-binding protein n=1 Tax=Salinibius halmophilus TaxID=1853216 RepID=UPI0018F6ADE0|nr:ABC transporter ATP-binding protein [Salinibius halmophilus]
MTQSMLSLSGVSLGYDGELVVHDVTLQMQPGELGCLLGPSGCGKSTLLRAIAGFEPLSGGEIKLQDKVVSNPRVHVAAEKRGIAMVFQDLALFPHLNIADNIAFGIKKWPKSEQKARIERLLELVGLSGYEKRYPHELSGGQQQRIALVRALAPKPVMILLDEPFSSLDSELREELAEQVREVLKAEQVSALMVTHDQMEAFAMADKVAVMNQGRLHQFDSAFELYHQPKTRFVANFVGQGSFINAKVIDDYRIETGVGLLGATTPHGFTAGQNVDLLLRPDDVLHDDASDRLAKVKRKRFRGSHFLYSVLLNNGEEVYCHASSHHNHAIGEFIGVVPAVEHLVLFPSDGTGQ